MVLRLVAVDARSFIFARRGEPLPGFGSLASGTFLYKRRGEPLRAVFPSASAPSPPAGLGRASIPSIPSIGD